MSDGNTPDDGFVHISEHSVGPEHILRLRARVRPSVQESSYEFRVQGPRRQSCTWTVPASYFGWVARDDYVDAIRHLVASPCHPDLHHDLVAEAAALAPAKLVAVGTGGHRLWVEAARVWLMDDGMLGAWDYPAKDRALLDDPHYVECAAVVAARLNEGEAVPTGRFARHGLVLSEQWRTGKFSGDRWITSSLAPLSGGWSASVSLYPEHERGEHCYRFKLNGPEPGMAAEWLAPFGGVNGGEATHYLTLASRSLMESRPVTHEKLRQELDAFGESVRDLDRALDRLGHGLGHETDKARDRRRVQNAADEAPTDAGGIAALRTSVRAGFTEGARCATRPAEGTVATMTDAKVDSAQIVAKLSKLAPAIPLTPAVSGHYAFPTTDVPAIDLSRWRGFGVNVETPDDDFVRLVCGRYLVGFREHGGKVELGAARIEVDGSLGEVQPFTTIPNDPRLQKLWRRILDGRGARHGQPDAVNAALDMIEALTGVDCYVAWTGDKVLGSILPERLDRDSVDDWSPEQHRGRFQAVRDGGNERGRVVECDGVLLMSRSVAAHGVGAVGVRGAECQISYLRFAPCVRSMGGVRRQITTAPGERAPFLIGAEIAGDNGVGVLLLGEVVPEVDGVDVDAELYARAEDRWPLAHAIRALAQRSGLRVGLPVPPHCATLPCDDGTAEEMKFSDGRFGPVAHVEVPPCHVLESAGVVQLYAHHGPSSDQLHIEIEHGAAIAAAYQLGRVATATIDAAVTKHLGKKALALSAFLRTPVGEGLVMAGAGVALRWLPGSSRAVRVVRDAVAPKMRQLALAEGADGIADALSGAVMRFVDGSPRDLGIGAIVDAAVPEAERAAVRIAALAGGASEDEWPQESVQESCAAARGR